MKPALAIGAALDVDEGFVDGFPLEKPLDRVLVRAQPCRIAVGQLVPLRKAARGTAELLEATDAVQPKRRLVRPGKRTIRIDDDHPLCKGGDDLLQVGRAGR